MKTILAIDPGNTHSAYVVTDGQTLREFGKLPNEELRMMIYASQFRNLDGVFIEMIASYGMPVGQEVFETCLWIGRFTELLYVKTRQPQLIYRKDVKLHLCGSLRANDATIRQALINRFGGSKHKAVGLKKSPGPLYGVSGDVWAALAVAITVLDTNEG